MSKCIAKKSLFNWIMVVFLGIIVLGLAGCSQGSNTDQGNTDQDTSFHKNAMDFLKQYDLAVQDTPTVLQVEVPLDWQVKLGEYPIGLYWG